MDIEIDGQTFSPLPRVSKMVQMLMRYQGFFEQLPNGQIVFDSSPSQVKIKLPPPQDMEKIPRARNPSKE